MPKIKCLNDVTNFDGRQIKSYCERNPKVIAIRENGDHVTVKTENGSTTFCDRQMGKGLFLKVIKGLLSIGITIFILWLILSPTIFK